ncbi:MAG: hypothetical protein IPK72_23490 [Candidatus Eisenbacteria bacterium]|nr:hypothetical protein [Candidatus Eisenbacteria bacterium]
MTRTTTSLVSGVLIGWGLGCGPSEPALQMKSGEEWVPGSLSYARVVGGRDGAKTRASYFFTRPDSAWLELRIVVEVDPEPKMTWGRWYLDEGGTQITGGVRADDVRFLGGQGGDPSLGGTFILRGDQGEQFRILLPPIPVRGKPGN